MADERLPWEAPEPPGHTPQRREEPEAEPLPPLIRASDLIDPEDRDQGDYEPGGRYKGFRILDREEWPSDHELLHGNQKRRFYVESVAGTIGLVPWDGSQVVWPWEQAWTQDMYRAEVTSFLKNEPKKK